jgi:hypothetical protein
VKAGATRLLNADLGFINAQVTGARCRVESLEITRDSSRAAGIGPSFRSGRGARIGSGPGRSRASPAESPAKASRFQRRRRSKSSSGRGKSVLERPPCWGSRARLALRERPRKDKVNNSAVQFWCARRYRAAAA